MIPAIPPHTVVLVEDDAALENALRFSLALEGWTVLSHATAEAMLAQPLPGGRFCMVSDLRLPGMSGLELLQELRRRGVNQPAILITGAPTSAHRRAAARLHARIVEKPLLGDVLLDAIREAFT